jgi:toxin ParE1/3/4
MVQQEANQAVLWYNEQREGLGDDFFQKLEECLALLERHPERFGYWLGSKSVRRVAMQRFPYALLFEIRAEQVRVLCLRHNKRHPRYGLGRV